MKVYDFLRKLSTSMKEKVHLEVNHYPSRTSESFVIDCGHLRNLGFRDRSQYPYSANILRIYFREGVIYVAAKVTERRC